ncbi:MAG: glycosyltransferase [Spirosomataceae bacterium]
MNPVTGGPPQGIRNITKDLMKFGIHTTVVSFDNPDSNFLVNDSFKIIPLGPTLTQVGYTKKLNLFLNNYLSDFDTVIIHGLWLYHSFATIRAIEKLKRKGLPAPKVFVMPHGMLDPWFQLSPSRRWKAFRNEIYWSLIERHVVNKADGILFTCQLELELARTTFWGYRPRREINVGYGILPPPPCTEEISIAFQHPRPYFLFLSRIHEKKGVDILIAAYQKLRKENTTGTIPDLVIAGPGLESTYGQKVKGLVLPEFKEYISFVGMLSGDKKWGALYSCEAFVLPSHQENFGIAVVEALACGKPVLISDHVNIWKEVAGSQCGIVFSIKNHNLIKSALNDYLEMSADQKQEMSHNGKTCFNTYFRIDTHMERLINSIKS